MYVNLINKPKTDYKNNPLKLKSAESTHENIFERGGLAKPPLHCTAVAKNRLSTDSLMRGRNWQYTSGAATGYFTTNQKHKRGESLRKTYAKHANFAEHKKGNRRRMQVLSIALGSLACGGPISPSLINNPWQFEALRG